MSNKQPPEKLDFTPIILAVPSNQGQEDIAKEFLQIQYQFKPSSPSQITFINPNQNTITIQTVREIIGELAYAPHLGKTRAFIFLSADLLSSPAQHALLKSLEEPPANTIILMLSPQPNALLPTIISRCEMYFWQDDETSVQMGDIPSLLEKLIFNHAKPSYESLAKLAQAYNQRHEAINLIKLCLWQLSQHRDKLKLSFFVDAETLLLETLKKLTANCNVKLTLENCFFELKSYIQ
jgi:hypothetical protein